MTDEGKGIVPAIIANDFINVVFASLFQNEDVLLIILNNKKMTSYSNSVLQFAF